METCSSPAVKRYARPSIVLIALTLGAMLGSSWLLRAGDLGPPARLVVALLPVALWGTLIVVDVLVVRALDELQKRIQLEALAIAFPAAMMVAIAIEYLQKAGFVLDWTLGDVWPFMLLLYVPAYVIARWRYR